MANINTKGTPTPQDVQKAKREYQLAQKLYQYGCDHKNAKGGMVKSIKESKKWIPDRNKLPETAVICESCGTVFDSMSFTPENIGQAFWILSSMVEQMKIFGNLSQDDMETLVEVNKSMDQIQSNLVPLYLDVIKKFGAGKNNNNNNSGRNKVKIGVSANQFASR